MQQGTLPPPSPSHLVSSQPSTYAPRTRSPQTPGSGGIGTGPTHCTHPAPLCCGPHGVPDSTQGLPHPSRTQPHLPQQPVTRRGRAPASSMLSTTSSGHEPHVLVRRPEGRGGVRWERGRPEVEGASGHPPHPSQVTTLPATLRDGRVPKGTQPPYPGHKRCEPPSFRGALGKATANGCLAPGCPSQPSRPHGSSPTGHTATFDFC